jgi:hypothetical protein
VDTIGKENGVCGRMKVKERKFLSSGSQLAKILFPNRLGITGGF